MSKEKIYIFDTTLRDGAQTEGVDFSIEDKNKIAKALSKLKLHYKTLTVNPDTFEKDIIKFSNKYICFNALHAKH